VRFRSKVLVRAVDSLDANERTAMHHTLYKVLTTVPRVGRRRCFGFCQDCAYLGSYGPQANKRELSPLNAYCSASRNPSEEAVSSATIFGQPSEKTADTTP